MTQNSNLFLSVGKQVKDEYERVIGKVASFAVNPNGRIDSVYIEQGDGRFIKHSAESLKVEGSEVVLLSKIKMETATLCDQIPLIWRKDQTLKELLEKKKISPELYEDLHNSFDGVLNQLKSEAQALIEKIDKETARCAQEIKELNYALVHLEIEHEIGKVDEQSYQTAFLTIQECLKRANVEKSDLEAMKNKLSNILLGETQPQTEQETKEEATEESKAQDEAPAPPSPNLPEPPVVVYVKEVGESGI
ncbi:MAG: CdvA-like protein [Candidatus Bathyarchaeales archaeon]